MNGAKLRFFLDCQKNSDNSLQLHDLFSFLGETSEEFLETRDFSFLNKVFYSFSKFRKNLENASSRKIFFHFFKAIFKNPHLGGKTLGITLALNFFSDYEIFNFKHLCKVIQRNISGVLICEESLIEYYDSKNRVKFLYVELIKIRGPHFTFKECLKFKRQFSNEIKSSIEPLALSLFVPSNEEEIYKNIVKLNNEITSIEDLPQVMINFKEQNNRKLKFIIILLRVEKKNSVSIKEIGNRLSENFHFYFEQERTLGYLNQDYKKQVYIFLLEVKDFLFLRKNHSVDLFRARNYVSESLKKVIGKFRDFNGGALISQSQQFEKIKRILKEQDIPYSHLIDEIFFSFSPLSIYPLITPIIAKEFFELFFKVKPLKLNQTFLSRKAYSKNALCIVLKSEEDSYGKLFSNFFLESSEKILTSHKKIEDYHYYFFIQLNPKNEIFYSKILKRVQEFKKKQHSIKKNVLKLNFQGDIPPSMHPHLSSDVQSLTFGVSLFEGLTRLNLNGKYELALAKNISISPCKKIYVFTLRAAKWSNGEKVTAFHFVDAWKKVITRSSECFQAKRFFLIKNAEKVYHQKLSTRHLGIQIVNDNQFQIELEQPADYFLTLLANPIFAPLYESEKEPKVFNGPFIIEPHFANSKVHLIPNPYYWDSKNVKLKGVEIYNEKSSKQTLSMFLENKLDWIGSPFNSVPEAFFNNPTFKGQIQNYEIWSPYWIFCNVKSKMLKSTLIRTALSYVIDRKYIATHVLKRQTPNFSILPNDLSLLSKEEYYSDNQIDLAQDLFKQGLDELGLNREDFVFSLSHPSLSIHKDLAKYLKNIWEKTFNIQVILQEKGWARHLNELINQEYEMGGCYAICTFRDPICFLERFEHSSDIHNFSGWENQEYKKNLYLAKKTTNLTKRNSYLRKAESLILQEKPIIPIFTLTYQYAIKKDLQGIYLSKFGYIDLKKAYFNKNLRTS